MTRTKAELTWMKECEKLKKENAELKKRFDDYDIPKDLLGLWEQTVCEIRGEIKAQDTPALVYAKELCDKLEHSMCALAGGPYKLRYKLEE